MKFSWDNLFELGRLASRIIITQTLYDGGNIDGTMSVNEPLVFEVLDNSLAIVFESIKP